MKILIISLCILLIGGALFTLALAMADWDISKLNVYHYETREVEITDPFSALSVRTKTADVQVLPAKDGKCRVVLSERENQRHTVEVSGGTLTVHREAKTKWFQSLFDFGQDRITVYLPAAEYESLSLHTSTGKVEIRDGAFEQVSVKVTTGRVTLERIDCGSLLSEGSTGKLRLANVSCEGAIEIERSTGDVTVERCAAASLRVETDTGDLHLSDGQISGNISLSQSTGDVTLVRVTCHNLNAEANTGDLEMTDVIASGVMELERSTGDVLLDACDAASLSIDTDTGKVSGTLRTPKVFHAESDTGRVRVPSTTEGGACRVTTDTGDIHLEIAP